MKFFGKDSPGSRVIIKGVPFESVSFSRGCALGPSFVRYCAEAIETFSTRYKKECENFEDLGDIPCYGIELNEAFDLIKKETSQILLQKKLPIFIGGDHTITLPIFEEFKKNYPDLKLLILDAHTDFREKFMDSDINHATWLRKLYEKEKIKKEDIFLSGIRENFPDVPFEIISLKEIDKIKKFKIYLSIDLDFFDYKEFNSVSNPVPGGANIKDLYFIFENIYKNLKGIDIVEFNPLRGDALLSGTTLSVILRDFIVLLSGLM